jgi:hypothetical protein
MKHIEFCDIPHRGSERSSHQALKKALRRPDAFNGKRARRKAAAALRRAHQEAAQHWTRPSADDDWRRRSTSW